MDKITVSRQEALQKIISLKDEMDRRYGNTCEESSKNKLEEIWLVVDENGSHVHYFQSEEVARNYVRQYEIYRLIHLVEKP